jgi:hypothetical protein
MITIIYMILAITGLLLFIWGILWLLGRTRRNKDALSFIQRLAYLDVCVNYGLLDDHSKRYIQEKFNEIEQMPDKDPEKIRELKKRFEERFVEFLNSSTEY